MSRRDSLAQTFYVDARSFPNGIFLSSVDLFFRNKSSSEPVTVQIRPTVNGYPSSNTIIPFATGFKEASQISISADGSLATNFTFRSIIYLAPGEYAFVVNSNSSEYELFTAILGEFSIDNENRRISSQPASGVLFKSQNASTWTPVQEEDLKFKLYKCLFNTSDVVEATFNVDTSEMDGTYEYHTFFSYGESIDFADTNIDYKYRLGNNQLTNYQLGSNVDLTQPETVGKNQDNAIELKATLTTKNRHLTPVIDKERLSAILVRNVINNDATGEDGVFGGKAKARYITRKVKLAPGFDSTDLAVYMFVNLPAGTNIKVYCKVGVEGDLIFEDKTYKEMILTQAEPLSPNKFSEYKYEIDADNNPIDVERFDTFAIKIVMLSDNPVNVPRVRDLRVIALDD